MKQIKTLYQDYRECILDIDIFGRIVSTPQQSLEELTEALFEEFKLRTPMPTLESKRYELSRPVSDAYGIDYEGEVELQDGESLVDLQNGQSSMPELNFEDLSSLIPQDVQECFRYEEEVTADYRKSIVEKYDLETGEEFKPGVHQTENIVGSVEEDTSTYLSDEQIENLGQAPQEEELAESSEEVSEVEESVWGSSELDAESGVPEVDEDFVAYDTEEQDDSDGDYVDVSEESDEENSDGESSSEDDGDYVDVYADSGEESDGYVDTGQDDEEASEESESEDDGDVYFGDVDEEQEPDDDGVYFGDEEQESEDDQESDDDGVYFGDEDQGETSEVVDDSDDLTYFDAEEQEESEEASDGSEDDIYFGDEEQESEESSEDSEDDIYFGDIEGEQEDSEDSSEEADDSGVGYDIDFGEDVEPEFEPEPAVQKPASKPQPMYSEPVRVSTQTPIAPQHPQVPDRSSEPTDIRAFLRKHPRCEYKFALNYFTKKQIDDAIRIGKIIKKGNILKI